MRQGRILGDDEPDGGNTPGLSLASHTCIFLFHGSTQGFVMNTDRFANLNRKKRKRRNRLPMLNQKVRHKHNN